MKNKEEIKKELKTKMDEEIEQYVEQMEQGFQQDRFDIREIEKLWGNAINGCKIALQEGTEKMLNTAEEKEIIAKKKQT